MKLQIDFDKKVIKVEDNVNLGELVEKLQAMLPEWKTWKLETNVTINWTSPTTIIKEKLWPYWNQPYYGTQGIPDVLCNTTTGNSLLINSTTNTTTSLLKGTNISYTGIHNIEL